MFRTNLFIIAKLGSNQGALQMNKLLFIQAMKCQAVMKTWTNKTVIAMKQLHIGYD